MQHEDRELNPFPHRVFPHFQSLPQAVFTPAEHIEVSRDSVTL